MVPGARAARAGDIITLYGTGFGATSPAVTPGAVVQAISNVTASPITVTIGNTTLSSPNDISYVGLSPTSISGLYQINVKVPPNTPTGDVPVIVTAGGVSSPAGTTIPIQ